MKFNIGDIICFNEQGLRYNSHLEGHCFKIIEEVEYFFHEQYKIIDLIDNEEYRINKSQSYLFQHSYNYFFQSFLKEIGGSNV